MNLFPFIPALRRFVDEFIVRTAGGSGMGIDFAAKPKIILPTL
jgi:hypothetical protein